jgi:hypothetical protein
MVVPSGSNGVYRGSARSWPAPIDRFRAQWRMQLSSADTTATIRLRCYLSWGIPPYVMVELYASGELHVLWVGLDVTLKAGIPLTDSPWVRVEVDGISVRVYICINNSADESLCTWGLAYEGTAPSLASTTTPVVGPVGVTVHAVSEGHTISATATGTISCVALQDIG